MKELKLTAETRSWNVFISEKNWLKLGKQKNVTASFQNCVVNMYKEWENIATADNGKRYAVMLQKIKQEDNLPL